MDQVYIKAKDISILHGCTERTAYRIIKNIRKTLGQENCKRSLTFLEYCQYENVELSEVIKALN